MLVFQNLPCPGWSSLFWSHQISEAKQDPLWLIFEWKTYQDCCTEACQGKLPQPHHKELHYVDWEQAADWGEAVTCSTPHGSHFVALLTLLFQNSEGSKRFRTPDLENQNPLSPFLNWLMSGCREIATLLWRIWRMDTVFLIGYSKALPLTMDL